MGLAVARKVRPPKPPDPANDSVADKLERLLQRKRGNRTDQQIAEAAGMSKQAFSRILLGGVPDPRLSTLKAVLKAIGATLAEFERA